MHTGLAATLPWLVHHYVPTIHLPSTSGNTPHCTRTCAPAPSPAALPHLDVPIQMWQCSRARSRDRKSTRLNSSHQIISYAVFCLKKKKQQLTKDSYHPLYAHKPP